MSNLPTELVTHFFEALRLGPPGGRWQFFVPNLNFGLELYIDFDRMRVASLCAMRRYPEGFAEQSAEDVAAVLQEYLLQNLSSTGLASSIFDAFCRGAYEHGTTLREVAHHDQIMGFAVALHGKLCCLPPKQIYLRPLWGLCPPEPIKDEQFLWVPGNYDINNLVATIGYDHAVYIRGSFPPIDHWDGLKISLGPHDSWIGVYSFSDNQAESAMQRIRGALSLTLEMPKSRLFSAAEVARGQIVFQGSGKCTISYPPPLIPPLLGKAKIDTSMLKMMKGALVEHSGNQRLQVALEYAAAGWEAHGHLGFLHNAIALDALFGEQGRVGESIKAGIKRYASAIPCVEKRAGLLYKIRNALMHGEYARIESCPQYLEYMEQFGVDPVQDQIVILRQCVWDMVMQVPIELRGAVPVT